MADNEKRVNVVFNDEFVSVAESDVEAVLAQDDKARVVLDEEFEDERIRQIAKTPLGQAAATSAAALRAGTLGLSDKAISAIGGESSTKALSALREENPVAEVVGQGIGIGASTLLTGGTGALAKAGATATAPARLAIRGGQAVENAARVALAGRVPASVARVAAKGAGLAAEGAAFGVGGAITESTLDPEFTADTALSHVGLGALLGGALGVAGTVGREVLGSAVPSAVNAATGAARKLVEKVVPKAARAGTDAAELRALTSAQQAHRTATRKAAAVTRPHARAITQAIEETQRAVRQTIGRTKGAIPTPRARNIPKTNAGLAATEAAGLSRTVRTGAMEAGDTAAQRAAAAYDRTIASIPDTDVAGRFTAAAKLRNTLPKTEANRHIVEQVDQHLTNPSLFGKAATEWAAARDATEALLRADDAFASTLADGATGRVSANKVSELLSGISEGTPRQLETLSGLSTQLDQYLAIVRRRRPIGPDGNLPVINTESLRAATNRFKKAVTQAESAAKKVNAERDAAKQVLDIKASAAAELAKKLLPNNPLGRAAMEAIGQGAQGGIPGALAGLALGVDPFTGAAVGNLAHMARNPEKFMGMLNRLHQASGAAKTQHSKALQAWLKGGKESGKALRRTAHFAPGLRTMLESKSPEKKREGFNQYRKAITEAHANPERTAGNIQDALSPVQPVAPKLAERIAGASLNRLQWLMDNMPLIPSAGDLQQLLDEADNISDAELNRFARVAAVVEDPTSILPRITDGTVTRAEVVALRETAPGYHQFLLETLTEQVANTKIPYSRRLTLGTVFEAPLTAGLSNVQVYQQLHAAQAQQQSQPQQLVTRSPTPSSQASQSPLDAAVNR